MRYKIISALILISLIFIAIIDIRAFNVIIGIIVAIPLIWLFWLLLAELLNCIFNQN